MRIDNFLLGFVIFSLVIVTGALMIEDLNQKYDINMSTDGFNTTFNKIDEMYNISEEMNNKTMGEDITSSSATESSIKGAYSAVRLTSKSFGLSRSIMTDISNKFGIPSFIITFAMTAITIMVVFGLIYIFTGRYP